MSHDARLTERVGDGAGGVAGSSAYAMDGTIIL
jgi:hypothetical protein